MLILIPFVDPGTIPKILPSYEDPQLHDIPIDYRYKNEIMR